MDGVGEYQSYGSTENPEQSKRSCCRAKASACARKIARSWRRLPTGKKILVSIGIGYSIAGITAGCMTTSDATREIAYAIFGLMLGGSIGGVGWVIFDRCYHAEIRRDFEERIARRNSSVEVEPTAFV